MSDSTQKRGHLEIKEVSTRANHSHRGRWLGAIALMSCFVGVAHAGTKSSPLATEDQKWVETESVKIFASPQVQKQIAESAKLFAAHPVAATPDGKKTLQGAVNELAFAATLAAVNSDPSRPKIVWAFTAPREWLGQSVPGSRWAIDNPDNVYRFVPIDGVSTYEIKVRPQGPGPVQYSFLLYDSYMGEQGKLDNLEKPIAGLRDRDIQANADGSFTITVDNKDANGRKNHIQSNADAKVLMVRNTFSDWQKQVPLDVSIKRTGGPAIAAAPSEAAVAAHAAELLKAGTDTVLAFVQKGFSSTQKADHVANAISQPFSRGGGWGFASAGTFKLADDEALVVSLDPAGAKYVGFDLTDPWMVSLEHIQGTGSLNSNQAERNKDGTYTYVVSARDPGVYNWLSTGAVHEGQILIRWQVLPESTTSAEGAVRSVKVVKLAALDAALPADTRHIAAAERQRLVAQRAVSYAQRYAGAASDSKAVASK